VPYAEVNDVRLYYEEHGAGEPLVLLPTALGTVGADEFGWRRLLPAFAARYRVIETEHRGHGRSTNPAGRLDWEVLAADVAAFVEQLGLAPVHLAGVSLGGCLGLRLGMSRPNLLRSLVCVGAFYQIDDPVRAQLRTLEPDAVARDAPEFGEFLATLHDPHHHPGYWRELLRQVVAAIEGEPGCAEADLTRIPVPTLLVVGEADPWGILPQALAMRRAIPHSELLVLNQVPDWNHLVQAGRADVVEPVVLDFLARHPGSVAVPSAQSLPVGGRVP
jgi:pimeloyl-ACP methyl ester carboxylesterase